MEATETLNNKILEERQIEKFSSFIETYTTQVNHLKGKLHSKECQPLTPTSKVAENVSFYTLTGSLQLCLQIHIRLTKF